MFRSKYTPQVLSDVFYPVPGGWTTFRFLEERKLHIKACAMEEDLAIPIEFNPKDQHCQWSERLEMPLVSLSVATPASSLSSSVSIMLAMATEVFSAKGDLGSLIWHMHNGKGHMVGQLHSSHNKGSLTSNHITYCTLGWYLLKQIKSKSKYMDLYYIAWLA
ncbi:hypothetical protein C0989_003365 [Termitomyces sp. Mn162]|nr:hypothetical protein C0989_003365 [Termitomyces sp. Mn162]